MQCPHCLTNIHAMGRTFHPKVIFSDIAIIDKEWDDQFGGQLLEFGICPACGKLIIKILLGDTKQKITVWPRHTGRLPVPPEVPEEFKRDYREACLILADSPNASAALSRRCLQLILRETLGAKGSTLQNEIQWVIDAGNLPSSVTDLLDVPRKVGNRAVHPTLPTLV